MKTLVIVIAIGVSLTAQGQTYTKPPLSTSDMEKGLSNFDYLRAVLLENGFEYLSKETNDQSEYWCIRADKSLFQQISIQVSAWKNEKGKEWRRSIFYQIRKDLLPDYAKQLQMSVIANYPEKSTDKVTVTRNGVDTEEYELYYFRTGSSITVKFEEDEMWVRYKFDLPVKQTPASSTKK